MIDHPTHTGRHLPLAAFGLAALLVSALIFIGWVRYGGQIFLSLIESGLAYCF